MASLNAMAERRALALARLHKAAEAAQVAPAPAPSKNPDIAHIEIIEYAADALEQLAQAKQEAAPQAEPKSKSKSKKAGA